MKILFSILAVSISMSAQAASNAEKLCRFVKSCGSPNTVECVTKGLDSAGFTKSHLLGNAKDLGGAMMRQGFSKTDPESEMPDGAVAVLRPGHPCGPYGNVAVKCGKEWISSGRYKTSNGWNGCGLVGVYVHPSLVSKVKPMPAPATSPPAAPATEPTGATKDE